MIVWILAHVFDYVADMGYMGRPWEVPSSIDVIAGTVVSYHFLRGTVLRGNGNGKSVARSEQ